MVFVRMWEKISIIYFNLQKIPKKTTKKNALRNDMRSSLIKLAQLFPLVRFSPRNAKIHEINAFISVQFNSVLRDAATRFKQNWIELNCSVLYCGDHRINNAIDRSSHISMTYFRWRKNRYNAVSVIKISFTLRESQGTASFAFHTQCDSLTLPSFFISFLFNKCTNMHSMHK